MQTNEQVAPTIYALHIWAKLFLKEFFSCYATPFSQDLFTTRKYGRLCRPIFSPLVRRQIFEMAITRKEWH